MTREEYIKFANALKNNYTIDFDKLPEFCDMAISALSEIKRNWIPISERLPEKFRFVNCTCHSLIDDREDWVVETVYFPQPPNSPYSDWGNIPMLNDKECEVTAWVYREIPEPYKAEKPETCKGCLEPCIMYEADMRGCKNKVTERGE